MNGPDRLLDDGSAHPVRRAWVFLDTPRTDADHSWRFWAAVTGSRVVASPGGADEESATLVPERGGAWVRLRAVGEGGGGVHLDLDVDDVHATTQRAESLGAGRVGGIGRTAVLLRSPGGFPFCLTTWHGLAGQVPRGLPGVLDQLCLDVPGSRWESEGRFWELLTGWELRDSDERGFASLLRPPDIPLRVLLQRLDEEEGPVRGHVDLACVDRAAETARHAAAGAVVLAEHPAWTVMSDPVGRVYCLTDRRPAPPRPG